ncbi:MAG: hypothetical protein K5761_01480 [Clostridiales bacterium]|nr:hypothetical protein [Clostridiales bacterium]
MSKINKNIIKSIAATLVGVLIIVYFINQAVKINSSPYQTEVVMERDLVTSIDTKAFVIRDESYINASAKKGTIVSVAEDGKRVGTGETVAICFNNSSSAANYVRINEINDEIAYYTKLKKRVGIGTNSPSSYAKIIDQAVVDYVLASDKGIDSEYNGALNNLRDAITTKQLAVGTEISVDDKIEALQNELTKLQSGNLGYTEIASPNPGYYIGSVDGYETTVDYDKITEGVSVADVESYIKSKPKTVNDGVMGKLVDAFNWYLICSIPYEKSGELSEGQTISVNLPNSAVGEIQCTVAYKGDKENDKVALVLKCGIMNRDVANLRIEDIEIITSRYTGFKISNDAIYEKDGEKGVYILRGDIIQFRKVKILHSTQEYSIIDKVSDDSSYVRQYDTVITEGTDLYDGKVVS